MAKSCTIQATSLSCINEKMRDGFYHLAIKSNFLGSPQLKQEIYYGVVYYSFEELKDAIEKYIKYYNEKRIKEKLGWLSPVQYRQHLLAA